MEDILLMAELEHFQVVASREHINICYQIGLDHNDTCDLPDSNQI